MCLGVRGACETWEIGRWGVEEREGDAEKRKPRSEIGLGISDGLGRKGTTENGLTRLYSRGILLKNELAFSPTDKSEGPPKEFW